MAINKELYERYKAMKAAKMQRDASSETTSGINSGGFKALSSTPSLMQNSDVESYSSSNTNSYQNYSNENENIKANYSSQFTGLNEKFETYTNSESTIYKKPYKGNITTPQYTVMKNNQNETMKFALIGCPLGHSLSEYIHLAGFKSMGIKATYELIETPPEKLSDTVKYLKSNGYSGFNVTIPLKLPVSMFLDEIDSSANVVNAINTVMINPQTKFLKGYNTDAYGFGAAIPNDIELVGKTAGILGTGGAARAAICALAHKNVKEFKLFTRNIANCIEFLDYLRKSYPSIEFNAFQIDRIRDLSDIDILVNATPIGMSGSAVGYTPVEEQELCTLPVHALVYDVIYNPKRTLLIKLAQKHGYRTVTGMDMLIYQAVEAQKIWTGRTPDFKDMKIAALENI